MRTKYFAVAAGLLLLIAGAAACSGGGDTDQTSEIRTQKGLSVAAIGASFNRNAQNAEDSTSGGGGAVPVAPGATKTDGNSSDISVNPYAPGAGVAAQATADGITVIGYGSATASADSAVIEFYFGRNSTGEVAPDKPATDSSSYEGSGSSSGSAGAAAPDAVAQIGQVAPITEAELQPVIDALTGAGVARDDIEFIAQTYYDAYFASATIRATVRDVNAVETAVAAVRNVAGSIPNTQLQSTNVSYTLNDCTALERAAMEAAVEDAGDRSQVLADVLGVGVGRVTGASNYSYSPYGGTPCDTGYFGPYPLGGVAYAEGQAHDVQVFVQITVTYAIQ